MARYMLKPLSQTSAKITLSGAKVGWIRQREDGTWFAQIDGVKVDAATLRYAFFEAVRIKNRIAIGATDEADARRILAERNAQAQREANEFNERAGMRVARVRRKKVLI